jgi:hypothetical protein
VKLKAILFALTLAVVPAATTHFVMAQGGGADAEAYSDEDTAFLNNFVTNAKMPSETMEGEVRVGTQLPPHIHTVSITGHPRFAQRNYAHVNNQHVITDKSGRVVAIHKMR